MSPIKRAGFFIIADALTAIAVLSVAACLVSPSHAQDQAASEKSEQGDESRATPQPGTDEASEPRSITDSIGLKLVRIPAGDFLMGSPPNEPGRFPDEHRHKVTISRDFLIGAHEITVGQFRRFVDATGYRTEAEKDAQGGQGVDSSTRLAYDPKFNWRSPGYEQTDNHPVVNVTWNDATEFVRWLSRQESATYRLPTEAEWEYACRAGAQEVFQTGDSAESLVSSSNIGDLTLRDAKLAFRQLPDKDFVQARDGFVFPAGVGSLKPNSRGLFDMTGNVCEWCSDWFDDSYYEKSPASDPQGPEAGTMRVFRGGSWTSITRFCRTANRARYAPTFRSNYIGFRVVRDVGSPQQPTTRPDPRSIIATTFQPQAPPRPAIAFLPAAERQRLGAESPWPEFLEAGNQAFDGDGGLRIPGNKLVRTRSRTLLENDFTFELEFTMPKDAHIACVGIGTAETDSRGNPVNAAFLRIHARSLKAGVVLTNHPHASVATIGELLNDGPHLIRIRKHGHHVTFEIDADIDGLTPDDMACAIPDLKVFVPELHAKNTHLFFGGSGVFRQVSLNTANRSADEQQPGASDQTGEAFESGRWYRLSTDSAWPGFLEASSNTVLQFQGLAPNNSLSVRTKERNFVDRNFVFEGLFSIGRTSPLAVIGLGESPDSKCAFARLFNHGDNQGAELSKAKAFRDHTRFGDRIPTGTHRAIVYKKGRRVQFAIDIGNDGLTDEDIETTIPDIREFEPELHTKNSHLFFGQGVFHAVRLTTDGI